MALSLLLLKQIISMILMVLSGFILGKLKVVTGEQSRTLSCVCIYLAVPCSLIISFNGNRNIERLEGLCLGLAAGLSVHLLYLAVSWVLSRGQFGLTREERASVIYNNAGNLIMPMVQNLLGTEYVLYTSPYMLVQSILMWTHGQSLMAGSKRMNWKKIVTNPAIVGIGFGLLLFVTGIQLPTTLRMAMEGLSGCMAPLSMLVTGIVISEMNMREIFCHSRIYWVSAIRLVLLPLFALLILLGLKKLYPIHDVVNILVVSLLCIIGPSASAITQQAQLFHNPHVGYVSSINVLTTILCSVTMPLMVMVFLTLA